MVNDRAARLDGVFSALSDSTRRGILAHLARSGEASVGDLASPFPISAPAISRHLRVLEEAGLITREKQGRVRVCTLRPLPLDDAMGWLESMRVFWELQLDALAAYLKETSKSGR